MISGHKLFSHFDQWNTFKVMQVKLSLFLMMEIQYKFHSRIKKIVFPHQGRICLEIRATWCQNYLNVMNIPVHFYRAFSVPYIPGLPRWSLYCLPGDLKWNVECTSTGKWWYCEKGMLASTGLWGMSPRKLLLKEGEYKEMTWCLSCAEGLAGGNFPEDGRQQKLSWKLLSRIFSV